MCPVLVTTQSYVPCTGATMCSVLAISEPVLPSVQYYPLFPERTSVSTVLLEALPGTRYPQDPVPDIRAFCTASSTALQAR